MEEVNTELIRFYAPAWLFMLALLPGLLVVHQVALKRKVLALSKIASRSHFGYLVNTSQKGREWVRLMIFFGGLAFLIVALARPQLGQGLEPSERKGLDVQILLDASLSMNVEDEKPNRFERAREGIKQLLDQLEGERVALTLFSNVPLRVIPFTTDYSAVEKYLDLIEPGVFVQTGTNMESALFAALPFFEKSSPGGAIAVFSDGEDEPGMNYLIAKDTITKGPIRVYCFGVGSRSGGPIPLRSKKGKVKYKLDTEGRKVQSFMMEEPLKKMARLNNGKYYPLSPESTGDFVSELNYMKKKLIESKKVYRYQDYFQYFLIAGFVLLFIGRLMDKG